MDKFMLNNNISKLLAKTYGWMVYALLVSGAIAGILGSILMATPALITNYLVAFIIAAVAELILVWTFGNKFDGMSYGKAFTVFTIFSALNGITLAPIFIYYTAISIATTFFITAGMFAIMSLIGYFTKIDLSKLGGILLMCLIGLIIASIVNILWANSVLYWVITYAGILIFTGLTIYDTQELKHVLYHAIDENGIVKKEANKTTLWFALGLYLDFINLLLLILRIFGNNK